MLVLPLYRLADPMLLLLVLLGAGLLAATRRGRLLRRRRTRLPCLAAWAGWAGLWLFSCAGMSATLTNSMHVRPRDLTPDLAGSASEHNVLVLLTGGWLRAPRPGLAPSELIGGAAYPRAVGAARIYRTHGFGHVIVSGVPPHAIGGPAGINSVLGIAETMEAFGVPHDRIILELLSTNTRENAQHSAILARALGAERVVVVTSALHMRRAVAEFAALGLPVIPAPVDVDDPPSAALPAWVPSATGLDGTNRTIHELLGLLKP
jgi:uncharacterized SAM-binding protein YcdF (DUF218 family)